MSVERRGPQIKNACNILCVCMCVCVCVCVCVYRFVRVCWAIYIDASRVANVEPRADSPPRIRPLIGPERRRRRSDVIGDQRQRRNCGGGRAGETGSREETGSRFRTQIVDIL